MKAITAVLALLLASCATPKRAPSPTISHEELANAHKELAVAHFIMARRDWRAVKDGDFGMLAMLYFSHDKAKTGEAPAIAARLLAIPAARLTEAAYAEVLRGKCRLGTSACAVLMTEGVPQRSVRTKGGGLMFTFSRQGRREYSFSPRGMLIGYKATMQ
jgi:hypothetical protein